MYHQFFSFDKKRDSALLKHLLALQKKLN